MVSTRRGTQCQTSCERIEDAGPSLSSQRVPPAAGRGRVRGRLAARNQVVVQEQRPEALGEVQDAHDEEPHRGGRPGELPSNQEQSERPQADAVSSGDDKIRLSVRERAPATTMASAWAPGASEDSEGDQGSDDVSDDEDDDVIFRPSMLDQLASSLRVALHARAGTKEASPSPHPRPERAGSSEHKLGLSCDPSAIRWQPEVKQVEMVTGPQRVAPGTGGTKEAGLAKQLLAPPRVTEDNGASASEARNWFKLPATKITDEVKQELRLLRLRGAYDPKRFYKSFDETKFPKHFQIGTVQDNPQDFFSSRLTNRERGVSITQELMADPAVTAARKKRYAKLQQEATRYQKVKKRKTDLKRDKAKPKRPKH